MTVRQRLALLERATTIMEGPEVATDLSRAIAEESGKLPEEAVGEVNATVERMRLLPMDVAALQGTSIDGNQFPDAGGKRALVTREPHGVVAIVAPFNYPLFIPANKAVAALLAGNVVVMKPASSTPTPMLIFESVLLEAGFPPGAFNVAVGSGGEVGEALVSHPDVAMVAFTGGTETGNRIASLAGAKPMQMELGGKGVAIVLHDADFEMAARRIVDGSLKNSGQRCDAISVVYLVAFTDDEYAEFAGRLLSVMTGYRVGRLIDGAAARRAFEMCVDAIGGGAEVILGGGPDVPGGTIAGAQFEPVLLGDVPRGSRLAREETFAPIVPLVRFDSLQEAIDEHNSLGGGLDSSVFTWDLRIANLIAQRLDTGSVTINDYPRHGLGAFPYGGVGPSGFGREGIGYSVLEFTRVKAVILSEPSNTLEG